MARRRSGRPNGSCSSGGSIDVPAASGRYFFGDYCTGTIWSLGVAAGKATAVRRAPFQVKGLSSFGEDARRELYLMSVDSGELYRLAR